MMISFMRLISRSFAVSVAVVIVARGAAAPAPAIDDDDDDADVGAGQLLAAAIGVGVGVERSAGEYRCRESTASNTSGCMPPSSSLSLNSITHRRVPLTLANPGPDFLRYSCWPT
jgi:hypothetical protein